MVNGIHVHMYVFKFEQIFITYIDIVKTTYMFNDIFI